MNSLAAFDPSLSIYAGKTNFTEKFDLVNGEYEVKLVALDASAGIQEWKLGSIKIWFKEGQFETNNQGVNKNYLLKETVIAQFPPPNQKEKNPLVSLHPMSTRFMILNHIFWHFSYLWPSSWQSSAHSSTT